MSKPGLKYADTGVDYSALDPFKRLAQTAAAQTAGNAQRLGFTELSSSRGESAYLIEAADHFIAHVEEGLGTKNLVADAVHELTGRQYYDAIAQDTVAMIVNDMITLGALPVSVAMHAGVGDTRWFADEARAASLVAGWKHACDLARAVWGGGESPGLTGVVEPHAVVLAGSAVGVIKPKDRLITGNIAAGDAIVMFASTGIHANGLSLARKIAQSTGYDATLSDGRTYGEALLDPTHIYVPVIEDVQEAGIKLHYAVNITGHGWRKLMRAVEPFVYEIDTIPEPQPVFTFMQEHGPVDDAEAYGNFNMGAGFAVYARPEDVARIIEVAASHSIKAWLAGTIRKDADQKKVVIKPKNLTYEGDSLGVR
ncbi:MAG TPA: AIR synthase-related protein [Candidatus Saccharimonadia bacterium]|nr:AIR synthase-related protein [Candidatus Saccharimonadia bacterium]